MWGCEGGGGEKNRQRWRRPQLLDVLYTHIDTRIDTHTHIHTHTHIYLFWLEVIDRGKDPPPSLPHQYTHRHTHTYIHTPTYLLRLEVIDRGQGFLNVEVGVMLVTRRCQAVQHQDLCVCVCGWVGVGV